MKFLVALTIFRPMGFEWQAVLRNGKNILSGGKFICRVEGPIYPEDNTLDY